MGDRTKKTLRFILLAGIFSVLVAVPALAAKIGIPKNPRWEGTQAHWDEVEDAYQYQIVLYKDGAKTNQTIDVSSNSMDLAGRMREKGKYTFKVRVRDRITDDYGGYSSTSSTYTQEKTVQSSKKTKRTISTRAEVEAAERSPGPGVVGKNWRENGQGWWYDNGDGTFLYGGWFEIAQKWHYFDESGYLLTGWITAEGKEYYCYPDGGRAVGWNEIDGGYYYFDESGVYNPNIKG